MVDFSKITGLACRLISPSFGRLAARTSSVVVNFVATAVQAMDFLQEAGADILRLSSFADHSTPQD